MTGHAGPFTLSSCGAAQVLHDDEGRDFELTSRIRIDLCLQARASNVVSVTT